MRSFECHSKKKIIHTASKDFEAENSEKCHKYIFYFFMEKQPEDKINKKR